MIRPLLAALASALMALAVHMLTAAVTGKPPTVTESVMLGLSILALLLAMLTRSTLMDMSRALDLERARVAAMREELEAMDHLFDIDGPRT